MCIYDSQGLFSAPRVYWTFKVFGHKQLHVLNGGLPAWSRENYATESGQPEFAATEYEVPNLDQSLVANFDDILKKARGKASDDTSRTTIIDARPSGRFTGDMPEPRPELPSGHIPNSISIPFDRLIDGATKSLKSASALKEVFSQSGLDQSKTEEIIVSCGTGVTACVVALALEIIDADCRVKVYDESWTGYADKSRAGDMPGMIIRNNLPE